MTVNDAHCHFFSQSFFARLAEERGTESQTDQVAEITRILGWEPPGSSSQLSGRWVRELDEHGVGRAALIASIPGDEESVAEALVAYPERFVGFFMVDPTRDDAVERIHRAVGTLGLRCPCLFPAMHRYPVYDERVLRVLEATASYPGVAAFVHCGVLSVGVRRKLGLGSPFAMRFSNPLDLHSVALAFPELPIIVPHFGAGLFRETLMLGDLCPNVYVDTSSSNGWIKYDPGLSLASVFSQAIEVFGPKRILFGTDSSFFPRGWNRAVFEEQAAVLEDLGADADRRRMILGGNFQRLFSV